MAQELTLSREEPTKREQILAQLEAIYSELDVASEARYVELCSRAQKLIPWLDEEDRKREAGKVATALNVPKSEVLKGVEAKVYELKNPKRRSFEDYATGLYELVLPDLDLYRDKITGETYCRIKTVGVETASPWLPIRSKTFRTYLHDTGHIEFGRLVKPEVLRTVIMKLDGDKAHAVSLSRLIARYGGSHVESHPEEATYYDLRNGNGEAVKVSPHAWEIVKLDVPLFTRPDIATVPQVTPRGDIDDIKTLAELLAFPEKHDEVLALTWIPSALIPGLTMPILNPYGPANSGKTTRVKTISQLIEPSVLDPSRDFKRIAVYKQPRKEEQAENQILNRHLVVYDNLYRISEWFAGTLSSTVYGAQAPKRKLHTDAEEYVAYLEGPLILSSIHRLGLRYADLQDRVMPLRCELPAKILPEAEYWQTYRDSAPAILGGIFSVLSKAIPAARDIELSKPSRFADFERYGIAISELLGYSSGTFTKAYRENRKLVSHQVIEADPVAQCLITVLGKNNGSWSGTPYELWVAMRTEAGRIGVDITDPLFPSRPAEVTKRLNELKADLARIGISYRWKIEKVPAPLTKTGYTTRKVISLRR